MDKSIGTFPFDPTIQKAIVKNVITNETFLLKSVAHIKREYFENKYLSWLYGISTDYYNTYNILPSYSVIKNEILKFEPAEQTAYEKVLNDVINTEFGDTEYLAKELKVFVQRAIFINNINGVVDLYNRGDKQNAYNLMSSFSETYGSIDFDKDDIFDYSNILEFIESCRNYPENCTPLGIRQFDEVLYGGLQKGDTCVFLGPTNIGKSMILTNVARNCVERQKKVLYLNLENKISQSIIRFIASMTMIPYEKFKLENLDDNERVQVLLAKDKLEKYLQFKHWFEPDLSLQKVFNYCKLRYKRNPFDILVIDYAQMIKIKRYDKQYQEQEQVMEGIELLARDLNIPVVTAVQANAEGQRKSMKSKGTADDLLRLTDIASSFGINRKTDILITMTASDKDVQNRTIRFLIDKNRDGMKGVAVECEHNFAASRIFAPELRCRTIEWVDNRTAEEEAEDEEAQNTRDKISGMIDDIQDK